ncbi:hemolysin family protein [Spirillospora sp. NPDC049652]
MSIAFGLLAVLLLTAATGYFVAQEFAFVTADRLALQERAEQGDRKAEQAVRVLERLSFMLSGAQLGITVTALVVGFIAEPALAGLVRPVLGAAGLPDAAVGGIALVAGFVIATVLQMVLGELLPKNLALTKPEALARALAASTLAYLAVAGPLVRLFDAAANRLLRLVGVEPVEELHHGATLEELGHIIGESQENLADDHAELLERALGFSDRTADQVMVPRVDVATVRATDSAADLAAAIAEHGFTRFPVLGEKVDDLVGVVGLSALFEVDPADAAAVRIGDLAGPALVLPGSVPLPAVVAQLRAGGQRMACVVDEYGGFAGVLTVEDVAEELVGEIVDENDADEPLARPAGDGWWTTDAGLRVDEVAQATGVRLPEGHYDTVAGLLLERLGRMPQPGDRATVDLSPALPDRSPRIAEIEIIDIDHHVPRRIRLRLAPPETPVPEPAEGGSAQVEPEDFTGTEAAK